ncbi:11185_t:CDS:2, partial [Paraglomus brasilianum]
MQQEYTDSSNQYSLYQDFPNELQTGQLPQQYQSSLNLSQLPASVLGPPSPYVMADEPLPNIDDYLTVYEQLLPGSIQQQNDTLSTRQNPLTHRQQRQQRWLLQHPYSRQREVQTSNKSFTPMRPEHRLDRQNSVQSMRGVFPIEQSESEYVQSQVYPPTGNPSMSQSQGNIHQVPQPQNNFNQLGNGFPNQPSQMETDERSLQSQVISHQREEPNN